MKNELKSVVVTFRVTKEEYERLTQMAKEKNQSNSQFITDKVFSQNGIAKSQQRSVYHSLLKIKDAVNLYGDRELYDAVEKECEAIWQCWSW